MYISLQNVRSMTLHTDDVLSDPIMQASTILCLTETSLTDKDWQGWKKFQNFKIFQKTRRETIRNKDEDLRKSGGVAVLVKKSLPSSTTDGLDNSCLELTSAVTEWAGELSHVSCIYKDHEMPKKVFISNMDKVFESHSLYPSIIAGDFNLYDEKNEYNELLNSTAQKYGFVPTVYHGTTIHDHLLDQIFITKAHSEDSKTVILPSYFSDHNLVVLCLPK